MSSLVRRFRQARGGTAAIEFCFIAPLMLMLYAGITEFGAILKAYYQTNRLATQYAMAWSDCSDYPAGTCQTELATYTTTSAYANIAPFLDPTQVTLKMFQFQMSGTNPVVSTHYPTSATLLPSQIAAIQAAGIPDTQYGVLVTVLYVHTPIFFSNFITSYVTTSKLTPSYTVVQLKS